ncbi:MAG: hypothetical protein U5K56_10670 [Halioglobus sp.]|nr:hypothetical protein [Halioglobus sp.]
MNRIALTLAGLAFAAGAAQADDCAAPETPVVPDGKTASMEEMVAGQEEVKAFQTANLEYRNCLDPKIVAATANVTAEDASKEDVAELKELNEAYNEAVTREEHLAEQFNTQIREFKAANDSDG